MDRTLRIDRRYTLGDYKYLTLEDVISDIPVDLAFNPEFINSVRYLQLLSFEVIYRKYLQLVSKYPHNYDMDKALEALDAIREEEFKKLHIILNGTPLKDGTPPEEN